MVPALNSNPVYVVILFLMPFGPGRERVLASLCHVEPELALTSEPTYPIILFSEPFGPGRGC